ncbi:MAG TPA: LCP family protein [Spirochaetota bacterium]|nr:LCP family protein [Spirochaetota bacterium]HOS32374.1 LCP family protein [Spirochaetota bacterium]HOS55621.1 LCP family protein [Spirochaetota bacterium]HPK61666.1 LCP family protein [Spirochaetota bacterium]HQF78141.1 LCP family protein [Spirochaetota bacterium]
MSQKELLSLLKKMIALTFLSFFLFIVSINLIKFADFVVKIDNIIKTKDTDDAEIPIMNLSYIVSESDDTANFNPDNSYRADEIGYQDDISKLYKYDWSSGYTFLLIGSDKANSNIKKARADVIILLRISSEGKIASISIPRDTLITISNGSYNGYFDKIGHSLYWDGLNQLKLNVERLVGATIDYTIVIDNFRSFEAFLAMIGGVTLDKNLKGKLGIQWIRNRNFKYGDIERCKRQQVFLKKSIDKLWKLSKNGSYIYSVFIYKALTKIVDADISKKDFISVIFLLKEKNFDVNKDYFTSVLPGNFGRFDSKLLYKSNLTCWEPDELTLSKINLLFTENSENNIKTSSAADFIIYDLNKLSDKFKSFIRSKFLNNFLTYKK